MSGTGRTYSCQDDPAGEQEARVVEAAGQGEHDGGDVGVEGVDGDEADYGGLGRVVDEPAC